MVFTVITWLFCIITIANVIISSAIPYDNTYYNDQSCLKYNPIAFNGMINPPSLQLDTTVTSSKQCYVDGTKIFSQIDSKCICNLGWSGKYCDFNINFIVPVVSNSQGHDGITYDQYLLVLFNHMPPNASYRLIWGYRDNVSNEYTLLTQYSATGNLVGDIAHPQLVHVNKKFPANNVNPIIYSDTIDFNAVIHNAQQRFFVITPKETDLPSNLSCLTLFAAISEPGKIITNLHDYFPIAEITLIPLESYFLIPDVMQQISTVSCANGKINANHNCECLQGYVGTGCEYKIVIESPIVSLPDPIDHSIYILPHGKSPLSLFSNLGATLPKSSTPTQRIEIDEETTLSFTIQVANDSPLNVYGAKLTYGQYSESVTTSSIGSKKSRVTFPALGGVPTSLDKIDYVTDLSVQVLANPFSQTLTFHARFVSLCSKFTIDGDMCDFNGTKKCNAVEQKCECKELYFGNRCQNHIEIFGDAGYLGQNIGIAVHTELSNTDFSFKLTADSSPITPPTLLSTKKYNGRYVYSATAMAPTGVDITLADVAVDIDLILVSNNEEIKIYHFQSSSECSSNPPFIFSPEMSSNILGCRPGGAICQSGWYGELCDQNYGTIQHSNTAFSTIPAKLWHGADIEWTLSPPSHSQYRIFIAPIQQLTQRLSGELGENKIPNVLSQQYDPSTTTHISTDLPLYSIFYNEHDHSINHLIGTYEFAGCDDIDTIAQLISAQPIYRCNTISTLVCLPHNLFNSNDVFGCVCDTGTIGPSCQSKWNIENFNIGVSTHVDFPPPSKLFSINPLGTMDIFEWPQNGIQFDPVEALDGLSFGVIFHHHYDWSTYLNDIPFPQAESIDNYETIRNPLSTTHWTASLLPFDNIPRSICPPNTTPFNPTKNNNNPTETVSCYGEGRIGKYAEFSFIPSEYTRSTPTYTVGDTITINIIPPIPTNYNGPDLYLTLVTDPYGGQYESSGFDVFGGIEKLLPNESHGLTKLLPGMAQVQFTIPELDGTSTCHIYGITPQFERAERVATVKIDQGPCEMVTKKFGITCPERTLCHPDAVNAEAACGECFIGYATNAVSGVTKCEKYATIRSFFDNNDRIHQPFHPNQAFTIDLVIPAGLQSRPTLLGFTFAQATHEQPMFISSHIPDTPNSPSLEVRFPSLTALSKWDVVTLTLTWEFLDGSSIVIGKSLWRYIPQPCDVNQYLSPAPCIRSGTDKCSIEASTKLDSAGKFICECNQQFFGNQCQYKYSIIFYPTFLIGELASYTIDVSPETVTLPDTVTVTSADNSFTFEITKAGETLVGFNIHASPITLENEEGGGSSVELVVDVEPEDVLLNAQCNSICNNNAPACVNTTPPKCVCQRSYFGSTCQYHSEFSLVNDDTFIHPSIKHIGLTKLEHFFFGQKVRLVDNDQIHQLLSDLGEFYVFFYHHQVAHVTQPGDVIFTIPDVPVFRTTSRQFISVSDQPTAPSLNGKHYPIHTQEFTIHSPIEWYNQIMATPDLHISPQFTETCNLTEDQGTSFCPCKNHITTTPSSTMKLVFTRFCDALAIFPHETRYYAGQLVPVYTDFNPITLPNAIAAISDVTHNSNKLNLSPSEKQSETIAKQIIEIPQDLRINDEDLVIRFRVHTQLYGYDHDVSSFKFSVYEPCEWISLTHHPLQCNMMIYPELSSLQATQSCIDQNTREISCECNGAFWDNECRSIFILTTPPGHNTNYLDGQEVTVEFIFSKGRYDFDITTEEDRFFLVNPDISTTDSITNTIKFNKSYHYQSLPRITFMVSINHLINNGFTVYDNLYKKSYPISLDKIPSLTTTNAGTISSQQLQTNLGLSCPYGLNAESNGCFCHHELVSGKDCSWFVKVSPDRFPFPTFGMLVYDYPVKIDIEQISTGFSTSQTDHIPPPKIGEYHLEWRFHSTNDVSYSIPFTLTDGSTDLWHLQRKQAENVFINDQDFVMDTTTSHLALVLSQTNESFVIVRMMDFFPWRLAPYTSHYRWYNQALIIEICKPSYFGPKCAHKLDISTHFYIKDLTDETLEENESHLIMPATFTFDPTLPSWDPFTSQLRPILTTPTLLDPIQLTAGTNSINTTPTTQRIPGPYTEPRRYHLELKSDSSNLPATITPAITLYSTPTTYTYPLYVYIDVPIPSITPIPTQTVQFEQQQQQQHPIGNVITTSGSKITIVIPSIVTDTNGGDTDNIVTLTLEYYPKLTSTTYSTTSTIISTYSLQAFATSSYHYSIILPSQLVSTRIFVKMVIPVPPLSSPTTITTTTLITPTFTTKAKCFLPPSTLSFSLMDTSWVSMCGNNGTCNTATQQCSCKDKWYGDKCDQTTLCSQCNKTNLQQCNTSTNTCECKPSWGGKTCDVSETCAADSDNKCRAPNGYLEQIGNDCGTKCVCNNAWIGATCSVCSLQCLNNGQRYNTCDRCGCMSGFTGTYCECNNSIGTLTINGWNNTLILHSKLLQNDPTLLTTLPLPEHFAQVQTLVLELTQQMTHLVSELINMTTDSISISLSSLTSTTTGLRIDMKYGCDMFNPSILGRQMLQTKWSQFLEDLISDDRIHYFFTFPDNTPKIDGNKPIEDAPDTLPPDDERLKDDENNSFTNFAIDQKLILSIFTLLFIIL